MSDEQRTRTVENQRPPQLCTRCDVDTLLTAVRSADNAIDVALTDRANRLTGHSEGVLRSAQKQAERAIRTYDPQSTAAQETAT